MGGRRQIGLFVERFATALEMRNPRFANRLRANQSWFHRLAKNRSGSPSHFRSMQLQPWLRQTSSLRKGSGCTNWQLAPEASLAAALAVGT